MSKNMQGETEMWDGSLEDGLRDIRSFPDVEVVRTRKESPDIHPNPVRQDRELPVELMHEYHELRMFLKRVG